MFVDPATEGLSAEELAARIEHLFDSCPLPANDEDRLAKLRSYDILDTPFEYAFDKITSVTASMFNSQIALVVLIDEKRAWIKSAFGFNTFQELPRPQSLCTHAILSKDVYVSTDLRQDPLFKYSAFVKPPFYLNFYAAAPLVTSDGFVMGVLCLLDKKPRRFHNSQQKILAQLAGIVVHEMELRLVSKQVARRQAQQEALSKLAAVAASNQGPKHVTRLATDALVQGLDLDFAVFAPDRSFAAGFDRSFAAPPGLGITTAKVNQSADSSTLLNVAADGNRRSTVEVPTTEGHTLRVNGHAWMVFKKREAIRFEESVLDLPELGVDPAGAMSAGLECGLGVPVFGHWSTTPIGVLCAYGARPRRFTDEDEKYVRSIADHVSGYAARMREEQHVAEKTVKVDEQARQVVKLLRDLQMAKAELLTKTENERMLLRGLDELEDAVLLVSAADGHVTYANRGYEKLTGSTRTAVIGKSCRFMAEHPTSQMPPVLLVDTEPGVLAGLREAVAAEQAGSGEAVVAHGDGERRWCMTKVVPVRSGGGDGADDRGESALVKYWFCIMSDTTVQKLASMALDNARAAAVAAMEAKSAFLANTSHEIRTPLNGVIACASLLLERHDMNAEQRELAEMIRISGEGLLTLVNDVLDFSKLEARKVNIRPVAFNVYRLVATVMDVVAPKLQPGVQLGYIIDPAVPPILVADDTRISQILINLLGNGVKFTHDGHVLLRVQPFAGATESGIGGAIEFIVEDSGIGISTNAISTIFESFIQADTSLTRRYGGTGLGLSICKELVVLMDGNIWVESEFGKGSSFHVVLPCPLQDLTALRPAFAVPGMPSMLCELPQMLLDAGYGDDHSGSTSVVTAARRKSIALAAAMQSMTTGRVAEINRVDVNGLTAIIIDPTAIGRKVVSSIAQDMGMTVMVYESPEALARSTAHADVVLVDVSVMASVEKLGAEVADRFWLTTPVVTMVPVCEKHSAAAHIVQSPMTSPVRTPGPDGAVATTQFAAKGSITKPVTHFKLFNALQAVIPLPDPPPFELLADEDYFAPHLRGASRPPSTFAAPAALPPTVRILIAEDHLVNQRVIQKMLRTLGHEADLAENGAEAVDACKRTKYDLVLMDLSMPVMSGLDASALITKNRFHGHIPHIVALTANVDAEIRDKCRAVGISLCISKPYKKPDIVRAIESIPPPALAWVT